jgi:putative transposase
LIVSPSRSSAVRGSQKGYDAGKKIWGRKRHLLVDTEGNLMKVKVTGADDSDLAGGKQLLEPLVARFPRMQMLWGDRNSGAKEHLGWVVQTVRQISTARDEELIKPKPESKPSKGGFQVLPKRWVVERSIAWIVRGLWLCRDHEGLPETGQAFIKLSASRRMLSHLAAPLA